MSVAPRAGNGKITVPDIQSRKFNSSSGSSATNKKITCLTAYDYPTARLLDEAGVEILLVGDSLGMVVLGYDSTLPVTLEEMLHHVRAVRRGTKRALLVADMPYGSFHVSIDESIRNAMRLVKEGGAEAIKIEGGERRLELIARLVEAEIPVMGHVGLTPQSINALGGFHVQGKSTDAARQLERDARVPSNPPAHFPSCWNPSRAKSPPALLTSSAFQPSASALDLIAMDKFSSSTISWGSPSVTSRNSRGSTPISAPRFRALRKHIATMCAMAAFHPTRNLSIRRPNYANNFWRASAPERFCWSETRTSHSGGDKFA